MVRCHIFMTVLHGCESWALDPQTEPRITAFKMYLYRKILKTQLIKKVIDVEILRLMKKKEKKRP